MEIKCQCGTDWMKIGREDGILLICTGCGESKTVPTAEIDLEINYLILPAKSSDIGEWNRVLMFGPDGQGYPGDEEWSKWID